MPAKAAGAKVLAAVASTAEHHMLSGPCPQARDLRPPGPRVMPSSPAAQEEPARKHRRLAESLMKAWKPTRKPESARKSLERLEPAGTGWNRLENPGNP